MQENVSLKPYNTFGLDVEAAQLVELTDESTLTTLFQDGYFSQKHMVLGGGSNVLLLGDYQGLVVLNKLTGKRKVQQKGEKVVVEMAAGENWHEAVLWTLSQNWAGIENLSLIPGTVGAAPMQNIGAYGVEIRDVFVQLRAFNKATGKMEVFKADDCAFGYRESVFKHQYRNQYIICSVQLQLFDLQKKKPYTPKTDYGAIQQVLEDKGISQATAYDVSAAVIEIRSSKLPNPKQIGNSGSFFKNPVVPMETALRLKSSFAQMPFYTVDEQQAKLAAGWLIEQCGWKGKKVGETGSHEKQALVLVNYGHATGQEIWQLALDIQASVEQKFGVKLEPEVNVMEP